MPDQPRAVWLTEDETNLSDAQLFNLIKHRFYAAPADPAEVITEAICEISVSSHEREICDAVLAALGFVVSSTETSTPDAPRGAP